MDAFNLDLAGAEEHLDGLSDVDRVVLGIVDGSDDPARWIELVAEGCVLVLSIEGPLEERVSPFAEPIADAGGTLMHFRGFLIVSPPGIDIDNGLLQP